MRQLDHQEIKIIKALIRDPRISDNQIGKDTKVPIRTVNRKRKKLENEGIISYFTNVNMFQKGTGRFGARHLFLIKFKIGITKEKIVNEIAEEPNYKTIYTEMIYESHIAEIDGHIALAIVVEGKTDADVLDNLQGKMIPALLKNHGKDSIISLSAIRLDDPIRMFHNYLPTINMKNGKMKPEWRNESIFVE